jgi:hypothetical protein
MRSSFVGRSNDSDHLQRAEGLRDCERERAGGVPAVGRTAAVRNEVVP